MTSDSGPIRPRHSLGPISGVLLRALISAEKEAKPWSNNHKRTRHLLAQASGMLLDYLRAHPTAKENPDAIPPADAAQLPFWPK